MLQKKEAKMIYLIATTKSTCFPYLIHRASHTNQFMRNVTNLSQQIFVYHMKSIVFFSSLCFTSFFLHLL